MKSKVLKTYNLPTDAIMIGSINAKPTFLFAIIIVAGLFLLGTNIPMAYSLSLTMLSMVALIYLPKVVMMEFYSDYMVLYNRADKDTCYLIYYDEVSSWYYSWSPNRDYLFIELQNGAIEKIEAFSKPIFETQMNRFMRDKRKRTAK